MQDITGLVAVTGVFTTLIITVYLFFNSRHKIRMALIQHGQDAGIFRDNKDVSSALKFGMVAVGVGMGLFLGAIFQNTLNMEEGPAYFAPMLVLGGVGLILYYIIMKGKKDL